MKDWNVQTCLKFANENLNDSEENWVKVLWSDETKINLLGINSTRHVWRRRNATYDPKNTIPTSNTEVETLGVFSVKGTGQLHRIKGTIAGGHEQSNLGWEPPSRSQGIENGSWMGIPMTMTQNTQPRQQRSGSKRSTLWSWWPSQAISRSPGLQTLIP